jgi:DNA (cytosine-5)-methyltransferase 1
LAHHYPDVPNLGDMTLLPDKILSGEIEAPDIFCGGTPCQAFSIAGNRESLDDARGNLSLIFCEIANAIDSVRTVPSIIFWENVPGVLNTKDNAFGCFLAGLAGEDGELKPAGKKWTNAGCVFGPKRAVAWRVLDAQYFGLAQRRKRVFVVASARNDFNPAEVLFEFDGLRRDTAPSRNSRETTTTDAQSGIGTYNKQRIGEYSTDDVASTCAARDYKDATDLVTYGIHTDAFSTGKNYHARPDGHGNHLGISEETAYSLTRAAVNAVAYNITFCDANGTRKDRPDGGLYVNETDVSNALTNAVVGTNVLHTMSDVAGTLDASYYKGQGSRQGGEREFVAQQMAVRRLTPTECERLQGFPDGYTQIPWRKKPAVDCPDGPRYKALGNSWAVPVVAWIGERILKELQK